MITRKMKRRSCSSRYLALAVKDCVYSTYSTLDCRRKDGGGLGTGALRNKRRTRTMDGIKKNSKHPENAVLRSQRADNVDVVQYKKKTALLSRR